MRKIPLRQGQAHFRLRTTLAERQIELRVDWLTRYGYYSADIYVDGELVTAGRGMHLGVNLLRYTDVPGELAITGVEPTPETIGRTANLVYAND